MDIKYRVWEPPCHLLFLLYYKKILRVLFIRVLLMFRFVDTLDEYHYIIPLNILIICTNDIYFMYTYFYYLVFLNTYNTISKIFHNYEMNLWYGLDAFSSQRTLNFDDVTPMILPSTYPFQ